MTVFFSNGCNILPVHTIIVIFILRHLFLAGMTQYEDQYTSPHSVISLHNGTTSLWPEHSSSKRKGKKDAIPQIDTVKTHATITFASYNAYKKNLIAIYCYYKSIIKLRLGKFTDSSIFSIKSQSGCRQDIFALNHRRSSAYRLPDSIKRLSIPLYNKDLPPPLLLVLISFSFS